MCIMQSIEMKKLAILYKIYDLVKENNDLLKSISIKHKEGVAMDKNLGELE